MFHVEWSEKPYVGFPPALSEVFCTSIQTLSTSSFTSLNVTFFAYFKCVIKISKGFKKWNCFRKTGLNTSLIVSIVGTETSVTKMISWSHQKFSLARSNAKSHSFFQFGSNGGLTWRPFGSVTTVFPYPNTEILLILELRIIRWVLYNQLYDGRFLFAGGTALVPFAHNDIR